MIIVEDEPLAAQYLHALLKQTGNVEVVGIAHEGHTGLYLCGETAPDAAFLDIHLPGPDGLALATHLSRLRRPPLIVFTTGHANRACEAFRVEAVDYLLKPLHPAQILETVARLQKRLALRQTRLPERSEPGNETASEFMNDRLPVKIGRDDVTLLLPHWEIVAALRHERRTWIHTAAEEYETYYPLTELQHALPDPLFLRVAREAIINLQAVEEVIHYGDRLYQMRLRDRRRTLVDVSRSCAARVAAFLKPSL